MLIYAHRGNSSAYPENTLSAFRSAIALNADGIETDIHLTRDGEIVLTHDEEISRVSDGSGFIRDMTYETLKGYDFGAYRGDAFKAEKLPKLSDLLDLLEGTGMMLNIEIKMGFVLYPGIEEKVLDLIKKRGFLSQVIFSSFNHYSVARIKSLEPSAAVAPLYEEGIFEPHNYAGTFGAGYIHPYHRSIEGSIIRSCTDKGIGVNLWTVNDPDLAVAYQEMGVSGIITDYPEKMLAHIRRKSDEK